VPDGMMVLESAASVFSAGEALFFCALDFVKIRTTIAARAIQDSFQTTSGIKTSLLTLNPFKQ
jgi:hypothetical protein